jgi:hypothetical protein
MIDAGRSGREEATLKGPRGEGDRSADRLQEPNVEGGHQVGHWSVGSLAIEGLALIASHRGETPHVEFDAEPDLVEDSDLARRGGNAHVVECGECL